MEVFNVEKEHIVNSKIFKKHFYDSEKLKTSEKNLIKKNIESLNLITLLKPETIKIPSFKDEQVKYLEIALIEVVLSKEDKKETITEIINKSIQYPIVLFLKYKDKLHISLCEKRMDKIKGDNNIIEDILILEDIENYKKLEDYYISLMYLDNIDLYKYYLDLYRKTYALKLSKDLGIFEEIIEKDFLDIREIYTNIETIDKRIIRLKNKIREEDAINRRVEFNVSLKKEEKKKQKLINTIMGD